MSSKGTGIPLPKGMNRDEFRIVRRRMYACYCDTCWQAYLEGRLHLNAGIRLGSEKV